MIRFFTTILADPPWDYGDKLMMTATPRGAATNYRTMSVDEIGGLVHDCRPSTCGGHAIAGHAIADDAFLWLWTTNPFLLDGSAARVCRAWGFEPKQLVPWIKGRLITEGIEYGDGPDCVPYDGDPHGAGYAIVPRLVCQTGMGRYTRGVTEHLVLATRGRPTKLVKSRGENGLLLAPEEAFLLAPRGAHSVKPDAQYDKIERVCPGPYLELFARRRRDGWTSWGDELP